MKKILLVIVATLSVAFLISKSDFFTKNKTGRLYSWIGQSNMDCAQTLTDLSPVEAARYNNGPISIANGYKANFYIWWKDDWQILEPGVNGINHRTHNYGPIYSFAVAETEKYPGEDLFMVVHAKGGTELATDWNLRDGRVWKQYIAEYNDAISNLAVTQYMPVYWGQGEGDAQVLVYANAYEVNEGKLMNAIFSQTGHRSAVVLQINNNNTTYAFKATVRIAKDNNLANGAYGPDGVIVSMDDLPLFDGSHLFNTGSITLGQRLSAAKKK